MFTNTAFSYDTFTYRFNWMMPRPTPSSGAGRWWLRWRPGTCNDNLLIMLTKNNTYFFPYDLFVKVLLLQMLFYFNIYAWTLDVSPYTIINLTFGKQMQRARGWDRCRAEALWRCTQKPQKGGEGYQGVHLQVKHLWAS